MEISCPTKAAALYLSSCIFADLAHCSSTLPQRSYVAAMQRAAPVLREFGWTNFQIHSCHLAGEGSNNRTCELPLAEAQAWLYPSCCRVGYFLG